MKPQLKASGQFIDGPHQAQFNNVPVFILQENNTIICYSPVFDLSGYGYSEKEAWESLTTGMNEFLKYTMNKKTLGVELMKLGWKQQKKKKFIPPAMSEMVKKREYLSEIMNDHNFRKESMDIELPA